MILLQFLMVATAVLGKKLITVNVAMMYRRGIGAPRDEALARRRPGG